SPYRKCPSGLSVVVGFLATNGKSVRNASCQFGARLICRSARNVRMSLVTSRGVPGAVLYSKRSCNRFNGRVNRRRYLAPVRSFLARRDRLQQLVKWTPAIARLLQEGNAKPIGCLSRPPILPPF